MTIDELYKIIKDRKQNMPDNSYITSLFTKGTDAIIQKVGEEAVEVVIAAKSSDKKKATEEIADLWFHLLILMSNLEITPSDIDCELEKRIK